METVLTKHQTLTRTKFYHEHGTQYRIILTFRYDDECGNGHNTFAMTADIKEKRRNGRWIDCMGGCCHDEIAKHFPQHAHYIKWHLCSSDGPMYYIENTQYHIKQHDFNAARSTAIWPEATDEQLADNDLAELLADRLPALMTAFQTDVESLGFTF